MLIGGQLLYNIVVVFLTYIDMNQPWVYMYPSILKPPPHPIPLGCPSRLVFNQKLISSNTSSSTGNLKRKVKHIQ